MFPGENEAEQMQCMMEVLGLPPSALLQQSSRRKNFFDDGLSPKLTANSRGKRGLMVFFCVHGARVLRSRVAFGMVWVWPLRLAARRRTCRISQRQVIERSVTVGCLKVDRSLCVAGAVSSLAASVRCEPRAMCSSRLAGKVRQPSTKTLSGVLRCPDELFLDLLARCFEWEPAKRLTPEQALRHPWLGDAQTQTGASFVAKRFLHAFSAF